MSAVDIERPAMASERGRMRRAVLAVLLAAGAAFGAAAAGQPPGPVERPDRAGEAAARREMRTYAGCVAESRPRWALALLAQPYLGNDQNAAVRRGVPRDDECRGVAAIAFEAPSLLGGMAEELVGTTYATAGLEPIVRLADADLAAAGLAPRNGYEHLALCILRRDPAAVRELVGTEPASPEERRTANRLVPNLAPCITQGQSITFDVPALRAMLAVSLYRALAALAPSPGRN